MPKPTAGTDPVNRLAASCAALASVLNAKRYLTPEQAIADGWVTSRQLAEHLQITRQHAQKLLMDAGDTMERAQIAGTHGQHCYRRRVAP